MTGGLEGLWGSLEVMDASDWVCPVVWGTLATIGAEVTALRDQNKVIPPPPAPAPDMGPFKAKIKAFQDKLVWLMRKLGSFSHRLRRKFTLSFASCRMFSSMQFSAW